MLFCLRILTACGCCLLEDADWLHHRHAGRCSYGGSLPLITSTALYKSKQACSVALLPIVGTILDGWLCVVPENCHCSRVGKSSVGLRIWLN